RRPAGGDPPGNRFVTGERSVVRRHHSLIPEQSAVLLSVHTSLGPVTFGANGLEGFVEVGLVDDGIDPGALPAAHLELQVNRLTSGNSAYNSELRRQISSRRFPKAYVDIHRLTRHRGSSATCH